MNLPLTGKINSKGHFEIGGCDTTELAGRFGTPLYIIDEQDVRERASLYKNLFKTKYPNSEIIFASKALCATGILKIVAEEGLGVDVSSGGELATALKANVNVRKIYFHGNNKSRQEIEFGLASSVGYFVVDNFNEIDLLEQASLNVGKKTNILIRVNPGVEAHTHDAVKTGQTDSKFGIAKETVLDAVKKIKATRHLNFKGLHAHIGSQIFDTKGFEDEIDALAELAFNIQDKLKVEVEELNIGGGAGVEYVDGDDPLDLEAFADAITHKIKAKVKEYKLPLPKLVIEPGRSVVARAGVTVYSVGHVKEIPGVRKYVLVDGGMSDNIRPMLYGAKYTFVKADDMSAVPAEKVTIAGRFCESGDVLAKDILVPRLDPGSLVAVLCTGAYNYSMASNYNRVPRPAMVIVNQGKAALCIKRETYEDLIKNDIA